jgi:hypothetical protein
MPGLVLLTLGDLMVCGPLFVPFQLHNLLQAARAAALSVFCTIFFVTISGTNQQFAVNYN